MSRTYNIPKYIVKEAWLSVKRNKGSWGVDRQSIEDFEGDLDNNLYKIWNRMSSGSYFPPEVRRVNIPKASGNGIRPLGVPTVGDRVAQTVVKTLLEKELEPIFHTDSYGYRPKRSAHDAIAITRKRCWEYSWLLEFDIKGMFDNIPHELIMKALMHHTEEKWILLYCERWLKAGVQLPSGGILKNDQGTPQGGVISPLLMNLFMHYAFDKWMARKFVTCPWARYADDAVIHCKTKSQALYLKRELDARMKEVGLQLHPEKTKAVLCKQGIKYEGNENRSFEFLGFTFQCRPAKSRYGKFFLSFLPGISKEKLKHIRMVIKYKLNIRGKTHWSIEELAEYLNPYLRGWFQYYGKFYSSLLNSIWKYMNDTLARWVSRKFKKSRGKKKRYQFLKKVYKSRPKLFVHWASCSP